MPVMTGTNAKPMTSSTAAAISPYGRPLFGLTSDRNDRNRMLVTISSAGTATTSSTHSRSRPCIWSPKANTDARTTPAAPGLGMPMKYRLSAVGSIVVLNRARRMAAQATQRKQTTQPSGSHSSRALGEEREGQQRGRQPERDEVGERVELQAERGDGADQPGDRAVGDVEDHRQPQQDRGERVLAPDRHQDGEEPAEHVGRG